MPRAKKNTKEPTTQEKWVQLLKERGVKQAWIAQQTGISRPHISNLLAGRVRLTFENKRKINEALGVYY